MDSPSMVEIAAKQRHVLLLKKVRNNQPLSAGELRELKEYEERMAKKQTKKTTRNKKTVRSDGRKEPVSTSPVGVVTAAEIEAAWDELTGGRSASAQRAAQLELLGSMAEVAMPTATAAEQLGFDSEDAFTAWLADDAEAGQLWRSRRIEAAVQARQKLWDLMDKGNAAAIRQILAEFDDRIGAGEADLSAVPAGTLEKMLGENPQWIKNRVRYDNCPRNVDGTVDLADFLPWYRAFVSQKETFDPYRVRPVEMEPLLGVSRQTLHQWTQNGMPKNPDGKTYNLAAVFAWRLEQVASSSTAKSAEAVNPLQQIKAEKLRIELDQTRNNLLERDRVLATQCVRLQTLVSFIERKMATLPGLMAGMTAGQIAMNLNDMFGELRRQLKEVPKEYKLTEQQEAMFRALLETMAPETEAENG